MGFSNQGLKSFEFKLFDLDSGAFMKLLEHNHVSQISKAENHPTDPNVFLTASIDGTVIVWDRRNWQQVRTIKHNGWIIDATFLKTEEGILLSHRNETVSEYKDGILSRTIKLPPETGPVSCLLSLSKVNQNLTFGGKICLCIK